MRVAYFIGTLKKEDGVTIVLLALIREAKKRGIESIIITGWAEDASISPVPVICVPSVIFPLYKEYRLPLPGMRGFAKKLDEFRPDLIHLHSPDTIAWAGLKYAKKNKIPILATHHTDFMRYLAYYHLGFAKPAIWAIARELYNKLSLVTTPSFVTADDLRSHKIKKVMAIPWGVDFDRFNSSFRSQDWRKKILDGKNGCILLCTCRLTWEKDLKTLAKAYNLLRQKRDDFKMVLAGDGPVRKELEEMMPGAVFLGHIESRALSEAYASSDILVFPSTTETFGNITIEALASGCVPVVADAGGSKTLVQDRKNGLLTRPKDSQDVFLKVNFLLDNQIERERMRETGLEFSKDFSWEKVFDKFLKIYRDLIAGTGYLK